MSIKEASACRQDPSRRREAVERFLGFSETGGKIEGECLPFKMVSDNIDQSCWNVGYLFVSMHMSW